MKNCRNASFETGDSKLKFGDAVTAVATYAVLQILIAYPITLVAVPALGVNMYTYYAAGLIAAFLSMLTVGYLFRSPIAANRRDTIPRIIVLAAFYELLVVVFQPTLADWTPLTQHPYAGTSANALEWFLYDLARRGNMFLNLLVTMGLGAFALHLGSKLKKPSNNGNPFKTAHHLSFKKQTKS
jgi:hypothetical protein